MLIVVFFRRALLGVLVAASLGACMILPSQSVDEVSMSYAATPLLELPDGQVVYLQQECYQNLLRVASSAPCTQTQNFLAVRQAQWDMPAEARARLARRRPHEGYSLDDLRDMYRSQEFLRPASARHASEAVFVGYFRGVGLIWVKPDAAGHWRYEAVELSDGANDPFNPVFVVRDGDEVWAFVERGAPCNEDLCPPLAATLGLDEASVPAAWRSSYMLYYARIAGRAWLQRVFPTELQRFLGEAPLPLPRPDHPYQIDAEVLPAMDVAAYQPAVRCQIRSTQTEYIYFVMMAPLGSKHGDSTTQLRSCTAEPANVALAARRLPPAPVRPFRQGSDDPRVHRERSSYYCWPQPVAGGREHGKGAHACTFVLRDPETRAALPRVPYLVQLFGTDEHVLEVRGVTDGEGRTATVRSAQAITLARLRVSRRIGPADFRPPAAGAVPLKADSGARGCCTDANASGRRLVRASDGRGIAETSYRFQDCTGKIFDGYTDPAGWPEAYDAPKGADCPLRVHFGWDQRRREN